MSHIRTLTYNFGNPCSDDLMWRYQFFYVRNSSGNIWQKWPTVIFVNCIDKEKESSSVLKADNKLKNSPKIMTTTSVVILLSWVFIRYSLGIPNDSQNSLKYLQNGEETEISIQPIQIRHTYKVEESSF